MTLNAISSLGWTKFPKKNFHKAKFIIVYLYYYYKGMAIGSLLLGTLADHNGRKSMIPTTMVLIFCASIGLSFAQTYFLISLCIFILGVG